MISNDPKFNLGQLIAYKLMFAIKLLMEKWIKKCWSAGFSDLTAINATVFREVYNLNAASKKFPPYCVISISSHAKKEKTWWWWWRMQKFCCCCYCWTKPARQIFFFFVLSPPNFNRPCLNDIGFDFSV